VNKVKIPINTPATNAPTMNDGTIPHRPYSNEYLLLKFMN